MKLIKRLLWVAFFLAIAGTLAAWFYLNKQTPNYEGINKQLALNAPVEVYFDSYGIPHIYAENSEDAYATMGYIHAQDRLFQMDLTRRVGAGRLSEVFGKEVLEIDKLFRTFGITAKAKKDLDRIKHEQTDDQRLIIEAYLKGINAFIEKGTWPAEYRLLGVEPEPFTMINLLEISGYMASSFLFTMRTDPVMDYVFRTYPDSAHLAGMDINPADGAPIIPNHQDSSFLDVSMAIRNLMDELPLPVFQGSNSWALSPEKTKSGRVIFCNDTHMKFGQPQVWYETHLEYPGFSFYGNFLAGIPFALVGHNRDLAWGLTMLENNDADLYYETIDQEKQSYFYNNAWQPLTQRSEVIKVKGEEDEILVVSETRNGPIINDFLKVDYNKPVSMWWTYQKLDNQLVDVFYRMNYAQTLKDMEYAASLIHGPGLNVNYGDKKGNIAWWASAKLVKRSEGLNPLIIHDGSDPTQQLTEFWPFSANPKSINPPNGYIYSCNNQVDTLPDGSYYPGYYAPGNRAKRLNHLLNSRDIWDVEQVKTISTDVLSLVERDINKHLTTNVDVDGLSDHQVEILNWLKTWSGSHAIDEGKPILYYRWLELLLHAVYQDELGEKRMKLFGSSHRLKRSYPIVLMDNDSPWWNNISTNETETANQTCTQTFVKAVEICERDWGQNYTGWRWGKAHQLYYEHPIGKVEALSSTFNVGPFEAPGGNETLNNAGFDLLSKEKTNHAYFGPQMRIIIDFSDVDHSLSITPTGQSGNFMSPHYSDQAALFVEGTFRKQLMDKTEIIKGQKLIFKPASN